MAWLASIAQPGASRSTVSFIQKQDPCPWPKGKPANSGASTSARSSPTMQCLALVTLQQCTRASPLRLLLMSAAGAPILVRANNEMTNSARFSMNRATPSPCFTPCPVSRCASRLISWFSCEYVQLRPSNSRASKSPCLRTVPSKITPREIASSSAGILKPMAARDCRISFNTLTTSFKLANTDIG